jgi:hypothetical protein
VKILIYIRPSLDGMYYGTMMSICPSVLLGFSTPSTYQADICFVAYLWVSIGCGKISYHSDLSWWSFYLLIIINVIYRVCHLSGYLLPQFFFFSEELLILLVWTLKTCMCQGVLFSLLFEKISGCWTIYSICRVHHLSGYLLPQFSSEDLLVLQNVGMDIEDMHMERILIFSNFWENYSLLNLDVF